MAVDIKGTIPAIVLNTERLYLGNLVHYFRTVFNEAENLKHPYHNFRHMTHVLWLCHKACVFYKDHLTSKQMRELLIAAMFHDFDHTGVAGNDNINIKRAVAGLSMHVLEEDLASLPVLIQMIRATEYPYPANMPADRLELRSLILRDADLSQSLSTAWIQQVVFGLSQEWKKSPLEVLKMQPVFHRNLSFNTQWAKAEFPETLVRDKIAEAEALLAILMDKKIDDLRGTRDYSFGSIC